MGVLDAVGDDPSCPSRVKSDTVERLIDLYENSDRPREAEEFRSARSP